MLYVSGNTLSNGKYRSKNSHTFAVCNCFWPHLTIFIYFIFYKPITPEKQTNYSMLNFWFYTTIFTQKIFGEFDSKATF